MDAKSLDGKLLDIFGLLVEIIYDEHIQEDREADGEFCDRLFNITIGDAINHDELMHTLLHETFHAYSKRIGLRQGISEETEEIIAESFTRFLVENFDIKLKP